MSTSVDLVTFGETMIRLSPRNDERLEQASQLDARVGGSELNTAVAAARLGLHTQYVTRLTGNPLGKMIRNKAREQGVDTCEIVWTDKDRVGTYYVEFGASPRANSVIYDRADSAMAGIQPDDVDWSRILSGKRAFHTSGITPALSPGACQTTEAAVDAAKKAGLIVSIDLNYRARLWTPAEARDVMTRLVRRADVLITTEEDTERVFGIREGSYEQVARRLAKEFSLRAVAITLRETPSVWRNTWSAVVVADGEVFRGPTYDIEVVDRVGAGDSFGGGFLYGYLTDGPETGVRYGVTVSALKQTNPGDFVWADKEEVERTLDGGGLRIVR